MTMMEKMYSRMDGEICCNADDDSDEDEDGRRSISGECLADLVKVELHEDDGVVPLEEYPVIVDDVVSQVNFNIRELRTEL